MPQVPTREIMASARSAGTAVGAFNVIHLETAEALVAGAEAAGLPIILQISENCADFHGALAPITAGSLAIARHATVPVALHLDHATRHDLVLEALDLGFDSVMYDGGALDYAANVAATRRVVERAHSLAVYVEAELGKIGGKDGAHAFGVRTDPAEAVRFVADTGVDALAVAVGSSHAMQERSATLDTALIAQLRGAVPVPLVLHGSSGVSDEQLREAVVAGMTKVNISTHLNVIFSRELRAALDATPTVVDSRRYFAPGRSAVAQETARLLRVLALA